MKATISEDEQFSVNKFYLSKVIYFLMHFIFLFLNIPYAEAGYFQLNNLMSMAQKNIPNHFLLNDAKLTLSLREKNTGHVVNTQFSNDGGLAGCGVSSSLMHYMYQKAGTVDLSNNYIALNVYSQIMGFDPQAPFWVVPEGPVKGYLTQDSVATNIAYPYTSYHRIIPSLYPAYLGLYNNGSNCGRWMEINFDTQGCADSTASGISKYCPTPNALSYAGQKMQAYVFDSCEDNNGWCRDDEAHIDVNGAALNRRDNYYLQWKFIKNPYYADPQAPAWLKDIWLAWFAQASKYWSYIAILNAEDGISKVQYNIGDSKNPTWTNSHFLGGDNNLTWSSTSNNGQLWQVEPVNALTDKAPVDNPIYQIKMFDYLGYPVNHGAIYQFKLLFDDGTLGQKVGDFSLFYQGGSAVKPGRQTQNMTILSAPRGEGQIKIAFNHLLPNEVSLDPTKQNYLKPILISNDGYAWDADSCRNDECIFSGLPTSDTYHLFAHIIDDRSNDLTLRKVNDIAIDSREILALKKSNSLNYLLQASDLNLSTLYAARIQIPISFSTTNQEAMNGNLQALFVPIVDKNNENNITAQTQGCFLNTYTNRLFNAEHKLQNFGNTTICTVYYTVNHQNHFSSSKPPRAHFNVILPMRVGIEPVNYALQTPYSFPIEVTGYDSANITSPTSHAIPPANYLEVEDAKRSLYLLLDPHSDAACLQYLDSITGVSVTIGNNTPISLTQPDIPIETYITQPVGQITAQVNLIPGATDLSCQAMSSFVPSPTKPLTPGVEVMEIIKLFATPKKQVPPSEKHGITATATGDTACLGANDNLIFSNNNGASENVAYHTSKIATAIDVNVPAGSYTITDRPFKVAGGNCQLSHILNVTIESNTYPPVNLDYEFISSPSTTCTASPQVKDTWPHGCTVQVIINNRSPLTNVTLFWLRGLFDWTHAKVWSGEGDLNIPSDLAGKVSWVLPSWVNGQGSTVGMTINNDSAPEICNAFVNGNIDMTCTGTVS